MTWFLAQGGRYQLNKLRFQTVYWIRFILKQKNTRIIETNPQRFTSFSVEGKKDLKTLKKHFPTRRPQQLETELSVWTWWTYSTTWRYWDIHTYIYLRISSRLSAGQVTKWQNQIAVHAQSSTLSLSLSIRITYVIIYIYISSTLPKQSKSG